mmetsp:Transcript_85223/g.266655  ORF Transcript_85223/g.266655 Transcript_85223/m.266655 type:complete len:477 (-) Transcript_85223:719-2149(-)
MPTTSVLLGAAKHAPELIKDDPSVAILVQQRHELLDAPASQQLGKGRSLQKPCSALPVQVASAVAVELRKLSPQQVRFVSSLRCQELPHEGGVCDLPVRADQVIGHLLQLLRLHIVGERTPNLISREHTVVVGVHGIEGGVQRAELRQVALGRDVRQHRSLQRRALAYGGQRVDRLRRDRLLVVVPGRNPFLEEGVLHALLHGGPCMGLLGEHELQQGRQLVTAAPVAVDRLEVRHVFQGGLPDSFVAKPREALLPAREELERDDAQRVHVALWRPEPPQPDFGRHIARRAARGAARHKVVGEAKVDHHHRRLTPVIRSSDHDVALLEVAVRDVAAVQVRHALEDLVQDLGDVRARHVDALHVRCLDEVTEVASVVGLGDDVHVGAVLKDVVEALYPRMVQHPQELELFLDLGHRRSCVALVVALHHPGTAGRSLASQVDDTLATLTQLFTELVMLLQLLHFQIDHPSVLWRQRFH